MQSFLAAEGFTQGRSYNIRMDGQVLLRFSPKNADSSYYFSDTVMAVSSHFAYFSKTLPASNQLFSWMVFFFPDRWNSYILPWRQSQKMPRGKSIQFKTSSIYIYWDLLNLTISICFQVSVTLETLETINRRFVHPSRRNSPTLTKVQMRQSLIWRWTLFLLLFRYWSLDATTFGLFSTGTKRSPWGGGRPYSNKLSFFNSHGWSNVVFYTSCFCAMDSSVWVPNYSEECGLKQVLLPILKTDSYFKDSFLFQSLV